ncbi:hypothetical protein [Mycolicibacterium komossense]|uniref:Transmembrane protein n=1 Tax=Mycolicibacterium komossense TaxID=1779 RepID=A0ABT3CLP2_9MYCO|nr:hypothetical protein [Mycolicibacterium komossense]MCV7230307.1 hypothetical protein [Mycolicibacterium komossense]
MTASAQRRRAAIELVLAALALAGAVWSALDVRSVVDVAPIIDGERATTSIAYDPPMLVLTLLLITGSAVLTILAVARWRRSGSAVEVVSA